MFSILQVDYELFLNTLLADDEVIRDESIETLTFDYVRNKLVNVVNTLLSINELGVYDLEGVWEEYFNAIFGSVEKPCQHKYLSPDGVNIGDVPAAVVMRENGCVKFPFIYLRL